MKIGNKIFFYATGVSLSTLFVITLCFTLLFPDLYLQNMEDKKIAELANLHMYYKEHNELKQSAKDYKVNTITLALHKQRNTITAESIYGSTTVQIVDKKLQSLMQNLTLEKSSNLEEIFTQVKTYIPQSTFKLFTITESNSYTPSINNQEFFEIVTYKGVDVYKYGITIQGNTYINFFTTYESEDTLYITYAPLMQSSFGGIVFIILQIIGSTVGIILILLLLINTYFARQLSKPIRALTEMVQDKRYLYSQEYSLREEDNEIRILEKSLHGLVHALEEKITSLEQEKKNQEFFMKVSSHQLKTPLSSCLLLVSGMTDSIGPYKDYTTYLPQLKVELLRLKEIVDTILSISSNIEISLEPTLLQPLLEETLDQYALLIEKKQINLQVRIAKDASVHTYGVMFMQILTNLMGNAITYSPKGSSITISYDQHVLCIENSGAHIEESLLPVICTPFTRGDTEEEGTGLGLYIVTHLCSMLRYDFSIQNSNTGVTVSINTHRGGSNG